MQPWRSPTSIGTGQIPFAWIKPPKSGGPPPIGYLRAHDLARLLDFLAQQQATYGESLTYHLAAALFYTCSRYSEIASRWSDCFLNGTGRIVALRIKGKGSVHSTLPVNAVLSGLLGEWRTIQEQHRGMEIFAARGLKFCRSEYVFAGPGGDPYTNQSFNAHLGRACRDLRLQTVLDRPRAASQRRHDPPQRPGQKFAGGAGGTEAPRHPHNGPLHPRCAGIHPRYHGHARAQLAGVA